MIPALEALAQLRDGNRRFVAAAHSGAPILVQRAHHRELAQAQEPFAIVLGCSDSRVPAEIVFDQGLGDLFVIRVAGNIVAPSQVGSVEFAAAKFGTRLVVVLGHSRCGVVLAAIEELRQGAERRSKNIDSIVARVRPIVQDLMELDERGNDETLVARAVRANIRASANHLRHASAELEHLRLHEGLLVVGAEYSLDSGVVTFFDGVPDGFDAELS
jgi:carbonic anhydrase